MRGRIVRLSVVAAVVFYGTGLSHAQVLIDDFPTGGDLSDWTKMDALTSGDGGGPGIFEIVNGEYNIRSTGPVPPDISANWLISGWAPSSTDAVYSNGYLRAKIRNNVDRTDVLLIMRGDPAGGAYYVVVSSYYDPPRAFLAKKAPHESISTLQTSEMSFPFDNFMDWNIEAGVVGNQVSMKVWQDGDPEPTTPQLMVTDPTPLSNGGIAVGTWNNFNNDSSFPLDATFDDIYFTPALFGDYNADGVVDAADYTVWRDNVGAPAGVLRNDPNGGPIGSAQYETWRVNFGMTAESQTGATIPEPSTLLFSSVALVAYGALGRRR